MDSSSKRLVVDMTDLPVLFPPGGMGYILSDLLDLIPLGRIRDAPVRVSCGAQPNADPHFGTITTFMCAFAIAKRLKDRGLRDVGVVFDAIDTAPGHVRSEGGLTYQLALNACYEGGNTLSQRHMQVFRGLLDRLSALADVMYQVRLVSEFSKLGMFRHYLRAILDHPQKFGKITNPSDGRLRVRFPCPACFYSEKHGQTLQVTRLPDGDLLLTARCFQHAEYSIKYEASYHTIQLNTPLRNVVRGAVYARDIRAGRRLWVRVTGRDWAGSFQEHIYLAAMRELGLDVADLPTTIYAPLICDWSGAKLSKGLYVQSGAYAELPLGLTTFTRFVSEYGERGLTHLWSIVWDWVNDPLKFFRNYSIYVIWRSLQDAR